MGGGNTVDDINLASPNIRYMLGHTLITTTIPAVLVSEVMPDFYHQVYSTIPYHGILFYTILSYHPFWAVLGILGSMTLSWESSEFSLSEGERENASCSKARPRLNRVSDYGGGPQ